MKYLKESNHKYQSTIVSKLFSKFEKIYRESCDIFKDLLGIDLYNTPIDRQNVMNFIISVSFKSGDNKTKSWDIMNGFGVSKEKSVFEILEEHKNGIKTYIPEDIFRHSNFEIYLIIIYAMSYTDERYAELSDPDRFITDPIEKLELYKIYGETIKNLSENLEKFNERSKYCEIGTVSEIGSGEDGKFYVNFSTSLKKPIKINVGNYLKQVNQ